MVAACGCAIAACGDDGASVDAVPSVAPATPTATATATPGPAATATPTATPVATPTVAPEADAGDEAGNRVVVRFELLDGRVEPLVQEVPAFLGLRLLLRNASDAPRNVEIDGEPVAELAPGESEIVEVEGLPPGDHELSAGLSGLATIDAKRAGE